MAAALVDDQLDRGARDRALRHLAGCDDCRAEVSQQRAIKARLDLMNEPRLPSALLDRLQSLQVTPSHEPPTQPVGGRPLPVRPLSADPLPSLGSTMRRRTRSVLVGATSLVLVGGGAAYAAGGSSGQSGAPVRPAVDVYTVQHGTTSGSVPLNDPAVSAVTVGFGR